MPVNIQSPYEEDIENSDKDFTLETPNSSLANKDNVSKHHVVITVGDQKIMIYTSYNQFMYRDFFTIAHNAF